MATFDYGRMQVTATRLLVRFQQGRVELKRDVSTPGPNPWDPPTEVETLFELAATAKRLHQRYENGVLVVETGDMLTISPSARLVKQNGVDVVPPQEVAFEPVLTDMLIIDGVERAITNLTPIPPAGTVVAWKAWCAA